MLSHKFEQPVPFLYLKDILNMFCDICGNRRSSLYLQGALTEGLPTSYWFSAVQWRIYIVKFWTRAPLPPGVQILQFHAVFGKIWQNRMLAPSGELALPPQGNPGSATAVVYQMIYLHLLLIYHILIVKVYFLTDIYFHLLMVNSYHFE